MAAASQGSQSSRPQRRDPQGRPPQDGYGVYVYPNSFFRYEGEWRGGKTHGRGKLLFKDGSYYEGEFADGEIMGRGCRHWAHTGEDGRVLRIAAGVRYVQLPAYSEVSFFTVDAGQREAPIQTPFGFQCIAYPLSGPPSAGLESARANASLPTGDPEVAWTPDAPCDQGDAPGSLPAGRRASRCPEGCRRAQRGCAQFEDVRLGAPPPGYHPIPFLDGPHEEASGRPRGGPSPGTGTPTSQDPPGGSRPDGAAEAEPGTEALPGEYVIMIQDVTTPPFLGRRLPMAFKHLRVSAREKAPEPGARRATHPRGPVSPPDTTSF